MRKTLIGAVALAAALSACAGGPSATAVEDTQTEPISVEDSATVALAMADSSTEVVDILNTTVDYAGQMSTGEIDGAEYASLMTNEISRLNSERVEWEFADVPEELDDPRDHYVSALVLYHEAFEMSQEAALNSDWDLLDQATEVMLDGLTEAELATAAIPATLG